MVQLGKTFLPGGRDDLIQRIIGGDDTVDHVILIDNRNSQQVVFGYDLGAMVLIVRQVNGDHDGFP